ncbi:uncharacterized protein LOC127834088 [Dreissena polymorpha]|uniref:Uncharacterized protein n=1 Tax=Dreissena polymorpha TaxID=45954 RepID=A0A9D4GHM9_DREPO|nr:uncharacterized protein LOC127834088 [Dreissena polymorpha]KAH3815235.1 hypothetical protein DPMN_143757 [Dreissena polymorpha]
MDMHLNINQWTQTSVKSTFMSTTSTSSGYAIVSAPVAVKTRRSTSRSKLQPEVFEPTPDYSEDESEHEQPKVHKADKESSNSAQHESEAFLQSQAQMTRQSTSNGRKFRESSASTKPLLAQNSFSDTASATNDCPPIHAVVRLKPGRHDISIEVRSHPQSPKSENSERPILVKTSLKERKKCCTLPVKIMASILAVVIVAVTVYLVIHFTILYKHSH